MSKNYSVAVILCLWHWHD